MSSFVDTPDWSKIPAPEDDGAARHLTGAFLPSCPLPATVGSVVDLAALHGFTVLYCFPRTGRPGEPNPDGWDLIPGARGCTPQSCAFRDHYGELRNLGVAHLFGLSTQDTAWQAEAVKRLHLPFAILSDEKLKFTLGLRLPTFEKDGMTLLKRITLIIHDGRIERVFYPVFPPDQNASNVIDWFANKM